MTSPKLGLHFDLDDSIYHALHDWLSATGIKRLIPPSTPAHFKAAQIGSEHKSAFDFGKAVHKAILGVGEDVVVIEADSWRTKAAQEQQQAAYAEGKVPILDRYALDVMTIANAVSNHLIAGPLLKGGEPEVSAFWVDEATGVQCRARFDYLRADDTAPVIVDVKTTAGLAAGDEFTRAAAKFGYYAQQAHYCDGYEALTGIRPRFIFVVVEKSAPYAVNVLEFNDYIDQRLAAAVVDRARRIFAECSLTDTWPAYPPAIEQATYPLWLFDSLAEFAGLTDDMEIR